ncbi:MAG TPA: HEAT repeat domain-containing protein, partial [Methanothermococcus okinawensis]|nr:HEAT repeat domain-containing protein [Methanothermococcus okinawensis]
MYDQMFQKDLLQLFLEYYKQDWKKRAEAARILGYINDQEIIEKLTPYIIELALDTNRFIRVNLAHSLKKIVLEYNIINEDIFVLLYIWANSPIAVLSEMARRIVSSLDIHVISRYVISLSLKLYSSEPIKVLYALFSIGFISIVNPEYIINTLPEIITTAYEHRYKLIQLLALEILEEFVNIKKEHLVFNFAPVYRVYIWTVYKKEGLQFKKGSVEYILSKYFKKHLTKDDITDLIYDLIQLQTLRKKIILLLMYTHFKPLRELLNEDENLGKVLLEEV